MIRERSAASLPGLPVLLVILCVLAATIYALVTQPFGDSVPIIVATAVAIVVECFLLGGVFVVNPNEGRVMQFFGDYVGTVKTAGLRWGA